MASKSRDVNGTSSNAETLTSPELGEKDHLRASQKKEQRTDEKVGSAPRTSLAVLSTDS